MADQPADTGGPDEAAAGLDELPIKLVFELGRQEISLGELRQIRPGYVFGLARDDSAPVEVYAGGRRIGRGELVRIEDEVGVRLVRLFEHG
jgi:type III secretion protein Q